MRHIVKSQYALVFATVGYLFKLHIRKSYWKDIGKVLATRYITGAIIGGILYFILPFEPLFRTTLLIGMILPIGMAVIPYSIQFDYDRRFVGTTTNLTVIISFGLMWLIMSLLSV